MKKILIFILLLIGQNSIAQELNVTVQVNSQQVQNVDKKIFETMRTSMMDFMNSTKWSTDNFANNEKIEATLLITINEVLSATDFKAQCQVEVRRPVYKSSYNSTLLSYLDENFQFRYVESQPFEFNENSFTNNLTSLCAFYSYLILAIDYDTFSNMGGTPYFQKAQTVVNNAQNTAEKGWKAFEGSSTKYNNRFYVVENALNPAYKPIREAYYLYHRKGLDLMHGKPEEARKPIFDAKKKIESVYASYPTLFYMTLFFNAKADELINIYSGATEEEKKTVVDLLSKIDAAKSNKYQSKIK